MKKIDSSNHPVFFGEDIWREFDKHIKSEHRDSKIFLLTDENVYKHCLPVLLQKSALLKGCPICVLPPGERTKEFSTVTDCWNWLINNTAGKSDLLINLGGGVVTDLGGFIAGTFKRGMPFIHIPTSLIGQADAAIGGKTGINLQDYKNQAGLICFPDLVCIDPAFLISLPYRELQSGLAEIVKSALIGGGSFWDDVKSLEPITDERLHRAILQAVELKTVFTDRDPYDRNLRKCLNFGHTIGHALEGLSVANGQADLSHGEAVAAGMICESFLSYKIAGLSGNDLDEITGVLLGRFPGISLEGFKEEELLTFTFQDKKRREGIPLFSLLEAPGCPVIDQAVPEGLIRESLRYCKEIQPG